MASFPTLKTGAIAQYPADRTRGFSTSVYRFVDGTEQRFAGYPAALRQWKIELSLLDESELETLRAFFVSEEGRAGTFSFTDPWDGTVYASCSFGDDTLALEFQDNGRGATMATVKENRT